MNFSNQNVQLAQGMYISSSTQQHPLGTRGYDDMGRAYAYCRAGASDLAAGFVIQGAAIPAGGLTLACHTTTGGTTPGSTQIMVTCVSAISTGFYNEGLLIVASGSGQGTEYKISSTPAVSTGATGAFTLYFEDAMPVMTNMTIATSSTISLIPNPYMNVIKAPVTTLTGPIVGVSKYPITATQYGWLQTWGPSSVVMQDTGAAGTSIVGVSATTGRAASLSNMTTGSTTTFLNNLVGSPIIGYLLAVGVVAEVRPVFLTIRP